MTGPSGRQPRSAAEAGRAFPYDYDTTCYIEIHADGTVTHGMDEAAYQRVKHGQSRLFAVWPGEYRSDLFVIDDLDAYARAVGIVHDEERTGLADHEHTIRWVRDAAYSGQSGWTSVTVYLDCGCEVLDIRAFAAQLRTQRGWHIATTVGWSRGTDQQGLHNCTVRVRDSSLR